MKKKIYLLLFFTFLTNFLVIGQDLLSIKIENLKNITDMPYICRDTIDTFGCGQTAFWTVVMEKEKIIPYLIEKLDDTTSTEASVPNTGGNWTVSDIAYSALCEIIKGIPTFDLLGVPFDKEGCGFCSYWFYLREDIKNRQSFKLKVKNWYFENKENLVWVDSDRVLTCDCSFRHPNGGHFEIKK